MTSKWMEAVLHELSYGYIPNQEYILSRLQIIDKLLRRAMNSIDDENLYDEIKKEIENE